MWLVQPAGPSTITVVFKVKYVGGTNDGAVDEYDELPPYSISVSNRGAVMDNPASYVRAEDADAESEEARYIFVPSGSQVS